MRLSPSAKNTLTWITLGLISSLCVLWLTFTRTDGIVALVFRIKPGQPIYDVNYMVRRFFAVWIGGIVLAATISVLAFRARKLSVSGYSRDAFVAHLAGYACAALVLLVVGISLEAWLGTGCVVLLWLWDFYKKHKTFVDGAPHPPPPLPPNR